MTDTEGTEAADVRYITGRLFKRIPPTPSGEWEQETKVVWDRIQADLQQAREEKNEAVNRVDAAWSQRMYEAEADKVALMDAFNDQAGELERTRELEVTANGRYLEAEATIERLRVQLRRANDEARSLTPTTPLSRRIIELTALTGKEQE